MVAWTIVTNDSIDVLCESIAVPLLTTRPSVPSLPSHAFAGAAAAASAIAASISMACQVCERPFLISFPLPLSLFLDPFFS